MSDISLSESEDEDGLPSDLPASKACPPRAPVDRKASTEGLQAMKWIRTPPSTPPHARAPVPSHVLVLREETRTLLGIENEELARAFLAEFQVERSSTDPNGDILLHFLDPSRMEAAEGFASALLGDTLTRVQEAHLVAETYDADTLAQENIERQRKIDRDLGAAPAGRRKPAARERGKSEERKKKAKDGEESIGMSIGPQRYQVNKQSSSERRGLPISRVSCFSHNQA